MWDQENRLPDGRAIIDWHGRCTLIECRDKNYEVDIYGTGQWKFDNLNTAKEFFTFSKQTDNVKKLNHRAMSLKIDGFVDNMSHDELTYLNKRLKDHTKVFNNVDLNFTE